MPSKWPLLAKVTGPLPEAVNAGYLLAFGIRIRRLLQERKLSQEDLGFDVGLDRTCVSDIERGKRNVGLKNVYALSKTLGVSLAELFNGLESAALFSSARC